MPDRAPLRSGAGMRPAEAGATFGPPTRRSSLCRSAEESPSGAALGDAPPEVSPSGNAGRGEHAGTRGEKTADGEAAATCFEGVRDDGVSNLGAGERAAGDPNVIRFGEGAPASASRLPGMHAAIRSWAARLERGRVGRRPATREEARGRLEQPDGELECTVWGVEKRGVRHLCRRRR
eukprot:scaffold13227_cov117-Isochrysis_galbana.AAC.14